MSPTAAARLAGFPFPFRSDRYELRVNVEPARVPVTTEAGGWGSGVFVVDGDHTSELAERARVLERDPSRLTVLPHMRPACWDVLLYGLRELADRRPDVMELREDGDVFVWRNDLLGVERRFREFDDDALPGGPLGFLGSQAQEDVVLLDEREGALWADAGLVTFASGWSLRFDIGMPFADVHAPVPRIGGSGFTARAERFILRLAPGQEYRRVNWSLSAGRHLDQSVENTAAWAPDRRRAATIEGDELAELLHLRVEVQHLVRLGESGAVAFFIRTHLASLADLARVPRWRHRTGLVLADVPEDVAEYKGIAPVRDAAVRWLLGS